MSREEKDGFTTPKKFAVITPSKEKKKERKPKTTLASNSFYSLSKESFHTIPDHLSPEKMDKKVKNEEPRPDESKSLASATKTIEPTLHQVLEKIVEEIDLSEKRKSYEIFKALDQQNVKTWKTFVRMQEHVYENMTMMTNGERVPVSKQSIGTITLLKNLIWKNMENEVPGAKLASTYTEEVIDSYIDDMNLKKRTHVSYKVSTEQTPAFNGTSTKTAGEKRYETWTRKNLDKTKFDILKEDKHYNIWKPAFEAELSLSLIHI